MRLASCATGDEWVDQTVPFLLSASVAQAVECVLAVAFGNKPYWFESHYRHISLCRVLCPINLFMLSQNQSEVSGLRDRWFATLVFSAVLGKKVCFCLCTYWEWIWLWKKMFLHRFCILLPSGAQDWQIGCDWSRGWNGLCLGNTYRGCSFTLQGSQGRCCVCFSVMKCLAVKETISALYLYNEPTTAHLWKCWVTYSSPTCSSHSYDPDDIHKSHWNMLVKYN